MSELKKIFNPFLENKGRDYQCFGCSPHNSEGLLMEFYSDGECVYADWKPRKHFEGYKNVIHGGIQATLMDEIASWTIYSIVGTAGVTQKMEVNYHRPLFANVEYIKIKATVKNKTSEQAVIKTEIINQKGIVCSSADVAYYLFPLKIAVLKYHYPGKDAFWK
ncbi:PaaI family thioesterase [Carboxylicivirga linearis]|uniref:PaaI family thioesterase n=1 Tax=Carboxylicivirga linearis TaxID=1628157 RepID=A0ABS5JRW1_9BACT|nr:PaaI family thioesterase [Carboxylicivirga linearis]MBS2097626.1 PaaI family thioesterase [Carboxylicivirga linearis]